MLSRARSSERPGSPRSLLIRFGMDSLSSATRPLSTQSVASPASSRSRSWKCAMSRSSRSDAQFRAPPTGRTARATARSRRRPQERCRRRGPSSTRCPPPRRTMAIVPRPRRLQRRGDPPHLPIAIRPQVRVMEQMHVGLGSGVPVREDLVAVVGETVRAAAGGLHLVVDEPPKVRTASLGASSRALPRALRAHRGGPELDQPIEAFVVSVIEVGHRDVERVADHRDVRDRWKDEEDRPAVCGS